MKTSYSRASSPWYFLENLSACSQAGYTAEPQPRRNLPGMAWCFADPFLLDSSIKVDWANDVRAQLGGRALDHPPWGLGDSCWYKPTHESHLMALPDFGEMTDEQVAACEAYKRKGDAFVEKMAAWFQQDVIYFMSAWVHNICLDCWCAQEEADGLTLNLGPEQGSEDVCCWCGKGTSSGIYKRAHPEETPCNGNHREIDESRTTHMSLD